MSPLFGVSGNCVPKLALPVGLTSSVARKSNLISSKRVERSNGAVIGASTEIEPVVSGLLRTFAKVYGERAIEFHGSISAGLRFRGERQDLQEIIGNLLDNAGKWATSRVVLSLSLDGGGAGQPDFLILTVDDDGPGLPADLRDQAIKRGRRLDETKPGSGLGLSIVADLAAVYAGDFTLETSPLGGLQARLRLPAA